MKIAVDAMGGDNAPDEIVKGAVEAAELYKTEIILVGDKEKIGRIYKDNSEYISITHSSEVIEMDEKPVSALKKKPDASIKVATKLVEKGEASALVSAGSTGAQMAASLIFLGRIPKVQRPAIATIFPSVNGPKLILDVGANTDCSAENLSDFAVMGSIYAENILNVHNPKVGLLNIGVEGNKGSEVVQHAYQLLKRSTINFYGNIEARDILNGGADIIVCDGFVGNSLLKFGEGMANTFQDLLKKAVNESLFTKIGGMFLLPGFKKMKKQLSWEEYGGAPLLGVNGVSLVCHGSSKARAITNAVKMAGDCVESDFVTTISTSMAEEKVKKCQ